MTSANPLTGTPVTASAAGTVLLSAVPPSPGSAAGPPALAAPGQMVLQTSGSEGVVRPARGETLTVRLGVVADGPVRVQLFTLRWEKVSLLFDGLKPAGEARMDWARRDDAGRLVTPGAYFMHAKFKGGEKTAKVSVAR